MGLLNLALLAAAIAANPVPGIMKAELLGKFDMSYPAPSPDGKSILFQGNFDGRWQLYLMSAADGSIRRLHVPERDDTSRPGLRTARRWHAPVLPQRKSRCAAFIEPGGAWRRGHSDSACLMTLACRRCAAFSTKRCAALGECFRKVWRGRGAEGRRMQVS